MIDKKYYLQSDYITNDWMYGPEPADHKYFVGDNVGIHPEDRHSPERKVKDFYTVTRAENVKVERRHKPRFEEIDIGIMQSGIYERELVNTHDEFTEHTIRVDERMLVEIMQAIEQRDNYRRSSAAAKEKLEEKQTQIRSFEETVASNEQLRKKWGELLVMCKLHGLKDHPFK